MQAEAMAKDLMFKLRLDEEDRKRLDAVAAQYSAPAATAVRMLIKEKYDALGLRPQSPTFGIQLQDRHHDVLGLMQLWATLGAEPDCTLEELKDALVRDSEVQWNLGALPRTLNELTREGLVRRIIRKSDAMKTYVLTEKGRAAD
jgi:hypothetical protein